MPRPPGRPSKLSPERIQAICKAVGVGCSLAGAAAAAEVDYSTIAKWSVQGEKDVRDGKDTLFSAFFAGIARARDAAEVRLLSVIVAQAPQDWRAAAWILERRMPEKYGAKGHVEITGRGGEPLVPREVAVRVIREAAKQLPQLEAFVAETECESRDQSR